MPTLTDLLAQMRPSMTAAPAADDSPSLMDLGGAFFRSRLEGGSVSGVLDKQRAGRLAEGQLARQEKREDFRDTFAIAKLAAEQGNAEIKAVMEGFEAAIKGFDGRARLDVWKYLENLPEDVTGNNVYTLTAQAVRDLNLKPLEKEATPRRVGDTRTIKRGRTEITEEWTGKGWQQIGESALDAPEKPSDIERRAKAAGLVPGTPEYQQFIRDATLKPQVEVAFPGADAFADKFGQKRAETLNEQYTAAQDALSSQNSIAEARTLLDKGIVTGMAADFRVNFGRALQLAGFTYADEAVANTEAYVAASAARTAQIIKAFGAGTGLSDADREYAEKAAAGKIALSEQSLRRILDINERANAYAVRRWNTEYAKLPQNMRDQYDLQLPDIVAPTRAATAAPSPAGGGDVISEAEAIVGFGRP